jgi:hypothetical protein
MEISSATVTRAIAAEGPRDGKWWAAEGPRDGEWWAAAIELENTPHLQSIILSFSKDGETYYQLERTLDDGIFYEYTYHKGQAIHISCRDIN